MGFEVDPSDTVLPAGVYLVEVIGATEGTTQKGDGKFVATLAAVKHEHAKVCEDSIVIAGKARYFGVQKLRALGLLKGDKKEQIEARDLVGRRCYVNVIVEEYLSKRDGSKRTALKVERMTESDVGYFPADRPPTGHEIALPHKPPHDGSLENATDVPF